MSGHSINVNGVRYITDELIKSITKEERTDRIKTLNLSCTKNDKPIKFIENLDSFLNLNVLILNFNKIEKIERLEKLVNLKELYLSGNKLSKLDGIESLLKLKVLDISKNSISYFPYWLSRRCKYLKDINISSNAFDSMEEISKLRTLKDLIQLNATDNPVTLVTHYRQCTIVRLKFLQVLDQRNVNPEERNEALQSFDDDDIDKLTSKLVEKEREVELMKEKHDKLEVENSRQANYQKDLNKKQKDYIVKIKSLEDEVKNKDSLLKKKSEDLFKTCQKYYELEQDLAFIKIDAKFDILNENLGSLDAPDDVSEHSFSGTGDHAYMGKGQFITNREAQMLKQRRQARQQPSLSNGHTDNNNGRHSSQEIKEQLISSLDDRIREKMSELDEVNKMIIEKTKSIDEGSRLDKRRDSSPMRATAFGDMDRSRLALPLLSRLSPMRSSLDRAKRLSGENQSPSNIADQFLEKVEHLTDMQREADDLRQQMEATERITTRQKDDIEYLRQEYEKMKLADPNLAHRIETEMHDKKSEVDGNKKLYYALSNRLDQLSAAIETSMEDIQIIEEQLLQENQLFTDKMKNDIDAALKQLSTSIPNAMHREQQKWIDAYRQAEKEKGYFERKVSDQQEELDHLKLELRGLAEENHKILKTKRPVDREVLVLKEDLDRLKQDAMVAKEDLESEIEMERVRNDELQKRLEEIQSNEYELQEQLQIVTDRYKQALKKMSSDQYAMKDTIDQSVTNVQDDLLQRINLASSNPATILKSRDPIDAALGELIKSVEQASVDRNRTLSPVIGKINEDVQRIKTQLEEINQNINIESDDQRTSHPIKKKQRSMHNIPSRKLESPMQRKLSKASKEYEEEMSDVKCQIDKLGDVLQDYRRRRYQKRKPKKPRSRMSYNRRRSEETSEEDQSSEAYTPRFKSRSYSNDRVSRNNPKHSVSEFRKWKSVQQDISSDEGMLDEIENELGDLRKQISSAGSRSTQKLEEAMEYINQLETEIQVRDEELMAKDKMKSKEREKKELHESLQHTKSQVERCQEDIEQLHRRLGNKNIVPEDPTITDSDAHKIKSILQSQKQEIERLNGLLEKLTSQGNPSAIYASTPQFSQMPPILTKSQPSQIFVTPNDAHINSQSTPLLNAGTFISTTPTAAIGASSHLFCNVPEHHNLEDYINNHSRKNSSQKMKNILKSETHKCMDTLQMLQKDINRKTEELEDVEIQVSKQTGETERLNYQINQLNLTKQDLIHQLRSLRHETDTVTRETIASTSESLGQMRAKKSQLNEEVSKLEVTMTSRRDELTHLERELHVCRNQLAQVQSDTSDTVRRYEEARSSHRKLLLECDQLEKRSNEASLELANGMHDLSQVQKEISSLVSNRANLEGLLTKTQDVISQKDKEFQRLTDEVNKATNRLNNLQSDLSMISEQNREKMMMISDGDQLLSGTRMELNHLKKEIEINQQHLEQMETDLGERTVAIELANGELERLRQLQLRSTQDFQCDQMRLKREITDLKSTVNESKAQQNDLNNEIEGLKMKGLQMKDDIERQEQTLHSHKSEVDRLSWQMQHCENMLKMKQGQLNKLSSEYNEKLLDLERLQSEVHQQEIESKKIDSDIKRKSLEVEKVRQMIALENENIQRLQFDKNNLDTSISSLTKERNLLQNQTRELESDLKNIKKQESQSHESLVLLESKLSQARSEFEKMCSEKCTETIKRDELKIQTNNISKQLHESKCELQSMRERLTMVDSQCDERTTELRKKMQMQNSLNIEIRKLQDQIRVVNMSFDEANSQENQKKDKLSGLDIEIARKEDELKNLEKKKDGLQNQISKHENKLEKILKSSSSELNNLKSEISEKLDNLEATGNRLHQIRKDAAIKEFTEQKIIELEQIIRQHESTIDHYEQENRRISNHLSVLSRDISALKENHQYEIEIKDKELGKLRKRVSREICQLEKLAEDHCQRANSLSDDLNQARRDYMLLRNRCLAQEHFIEQQHLFKEYMQPSHPRSDLHQSMETAMLTEHRRHLQNQLNLLRDNISSAALSTTNGLENHHQETSATFNKSVDGDKRWGYTTSSSGIGSTLEHNTSDTSPENEHVKKSLHNQFNEEIEMMHYENTRSQDMCRQLRTEVNNLRSNLPNDKSTAAFSD